MPFSRSRSIESMTRSDRSLVAWCAVNAPDCQSMASTSVVLPWSTWATIATLRRSSRVGSDAPALLNSVVLDLRRWPGSQGPTPHPGTAGRRILCIVRSRARRIRSSRYATDAAHAQRGETHGLGHPRHTGGHCAHPVRRTQRQRAGRDSPRARCGRTTGARPRSSPWSCSPSGSSTRRSGPSCRSGYWVEDYHYLTPFYSPCVSNGCVPATRRSSAGSCRTSRSSRSPR